MNTLLNHRRKLTNYQRTPVSSRSSEQICRGSGEMNFDVQCCSDGEEQRRRSFFYERDAVLSRVLAMILCHKCRCSIETVERIGLVLAWELPSICHTLCCKEIQVRSKISVLPSGTLLQTLDLENFATAYRPSKRGINLAPERWTLRA